jgi:Cu/Ag efflux protein CusF
MRVTSLALAAIAALLASPALACDDHAPGTEPVKPSLSRPSGWIEGEVREVDVDEGTVAMGHAKIARWRMEPMTSMMFKARDAALLSSVKPGDKVKFRAAMLGPQPMITDIKLATK